MGNKMKLKTLKDFRRPKDEESPYVGEWAMGVNEGCDKLKAEAIKWVKFGFHKNKEGKWVKWKEMFKEFFNITEEDLK